MPGHSPSLEWLSHIFKLNFQLMLSSAVKTQCQIGTEPHFSPAGVLAPQTNTGKCPFYWNCKNSSVWLRTFVWFCVAPVQQLNASVWFSSLYSYVKEFRTFCLNVIKFILILFVFWDLTWQTGKWQDRAQEPDKSLFESSVITEE